MAAPKNFQSTSPSPSASTTFMIIQNGNPAKMMLINTSTGNIEKELPLTPAIPASTHDNFRRARMTAAGTLLAPTWTINKVSEYDMDGKEIWSLAVPSPWAAVRLKNGNTLVSSNKGFRPRIHFPRG